MAISFLWSSKAWIAGNGDRFGRALLEGAAPCHGPCLISFYLVQFIYEYQTKERWLFVKEETHEDMLMSLMLDSLKTAADACPVATPARSGAPVPDVQLTQGLAPDSKGPGVKPEPATCLHLVQVMELGESVSPTRMYTVIVVCRFASAHDLNGTCNLHPCTTRTYMAIVTWGRASLHHQDTHGTCNLGICIPASQGHKWEL